MTFWLEVGFWSAAALLAYIYVGYPPLTWLVSRLWPRPFRRDATGEPTVTIAIAAYNEEAHIGSTLQNKLSLSYPREKVQIVVVSDGSSDRTDEIARSLASPRLTVLRQEPRNGKTSALNLAVQHATGEILVFSDANSEYAPDALQSLLAPFADPAVGYVTGKLVYLNPDGSMTGDGCGLYMRYENALRQWESAGGSIVGVNGGIDAVRRSLYSPMHPDDLPDLVLPLRVIAEGYRVVYEPRAVLKERALTNARDEYRMRVRVSLRALWTLLEWRRLLNVFRHGRFAVQLFSHKVLRYTSFIAFIVLFATSLLLWSQPLYRWAAAAQAAGLIAAGAGLIAERAHRPNRLLSVPYYFLLIHVAASHAFVKFLRRQRHRVWRPRLG